MKRVYIKPVITDYSRDEIAEMIGPVRTQYPCVCESQVQPNPLPGKQLNTLQISFSTSGDCENYERVIITVPGSNPLIFFDFTRGQGIENGDTWSINVPNFQYLGNAGLYPVEITLTDASGFVELFSCDTTLTIE